MSFQLQTWTKSKTPVFNQTILQGGIPYPPGKPRGHAAGRSISPLRYYLAAVAFTRALFKRLLRRLATLRWIVPLLTALSRAEEHALNSDFDTAASPPARAARPCFRRRRRARHLPWGRGGGGERQQNHFCCRMRSFLILRMNRSQDTTIHTITPPRQQS